MATIVNAPIQSGFTLAAPASAPTTVFSGTGGLLGNGNYSYKVTFVTANGETLPSTNSVAASPGTSTGSCAISAIPTGNAYVIARKLYRTTAGGGAYNLLATISDNTTTTYADIIADGSLGASAPTVSTSDTPIPIRSVKGATSSVTQITSNGTAVTTTALCGIITMQGTIIASGTATFTLNNANITATSNVIAWANMVSTTGAKPVTVTVASIAAGSAAITVTNTDGSNATAAVAQVYYLIL